MTAKVAYLVSYYPGLSLAFIDREIDALRARGREVRTFGIRPSKADDQRTEDAARRAAETRTVLGDGPAPVLKAALTIALRRPRTALAGLRHALTAGPARPRHRIWQLFYLAEAARLLELLDSADIRHIHVHFANNAADIARTAVVLGNRRDGGGWSWSFSMHGPTEFEDPVGYDLRAKVESAVFVACITDFCRSQLMRWTPPELWDRLDVVRMAVDTDRYRPVSRTRAAGAPLRVLFVGRLVPEKGPTVLLDAVRQAQDVPLEVQIVGTGPLAEQLADQVAKERLGDRVALVGPLGQDELPDRYAWADVLVLPSFAEGLPVVLMEALATSLPVVTTPIAGIGELVRDGETGTLTAPGRADLLARALRDLWLDPEARKEQGLAGGVQVTQHHNPGLNAARLDSMLP